MKSLSVVAWIAAVFAAVVSEAAIELEGMGALAPVPYYHSNSTGLSADGTTVVGFSYHNPSRYFGGYRWTRDSGIESLGFLHPYLQKSWATAVNGDGSLVVGYSFLSASVGEACLWTGPGAIERLGFLYTGYLALSRADGISADGTTIVGQSRNTDSNLEAIRLDRTITPYVMEGLGALNPSQFWSMAKAVSGDGSVITGFS